MPLRTLLYAVLHWQSEWQAWEQQHPAGESLQLTPITPIVFHTGGAPWRAFRTMAALIRGPDALAGFAPVWEPLFYDLAEHPTDDLLGAVGEFLVALAVVRAERAGSKALSDVFARVLERLEGLSERDRVRWEGLVWFVLSWGLRRRPEEEQTALLEAARNSQADVRHREEVQQMSETVVQTWEQELIARGEARGRAEGELQAYRDNLRLLLEERFGAVPEALAQQIAAIEDLERLRGALRRALRVATLAELEL